MTVGVCDVEQYSARGIALLVTSWPQPPPPWDTQDAANWQLSRVQVAAGPQVLRLWGWMWSALTRSKDCREHEQSPATFLNPC